MKRRGPTKLAESINQTTANAKRDTKGKRSGVDLRVDPSLKDPSMVDDQSPSEAEGDNRSMSTIKRPAPTSRARVKVADRWAAALVTSSIAGDLTAVAGATLNEEVVNLVTSPATSDANVAMFVAASGIKVIGNVITESPYGPPSRVGTVGSGLMKKSKTEPEFSQTTSSIGCSDRLSTTNSVPVQPDPKQSNSSMATKERSSVVDASLLTSLLNQMQPRSSKKLPSPNANKMIAAPQNGRSDDPRRIAPIVSKMASGGLSVAGALEGRRGTSVREVLRQLGEPGQVHGALVAIKRHLRNEAEITTFRRHDGLQRVLEVIPKVELRSAEVAFSILASCCMEEKSRLKILEVDGIQLCCNAMKSAEADGLRNRIARTLGNLSQSEACCDVIHDQSDAVETIVQWLGSVTDSFCLQTLCRTVRSLADDPDHTQALVDCFGVRAVASLLASQDSAVAEAALKAVTHFMRSSEYSEECCRQFAEADALPPLVSLASRDPGAVALLVRTARISALSPHLAKAGGMEYFVGEIETFLKPSSVADGMERGVPGREGKEEEVVETDGRRDTTTVTKSKLDVAGCVTFVAALCQALRWSANARWLAQHDKLLLLLRLLDSAELQPCRHQVVGALCCMCRVADSDCFTSLLRLGTDAAAPLLRALYACTGVSPPGGGAAEPLGTLSLRGCGVSPAYWDLEGMRCERVQENIVSNDDYDDDDEDTDDDSDAGDYDGVDFDEGDECEKLEKALSAEVDSESVSRANGANNCQDDTQRLGDEQVVTNCADADALGQNDGSDRQQNFVAATAVVEYLTTGCSLTTDSLSTSYSMMGNTAPSNTVSAWHTQSKEEEEVMEEGSQEEEWCPMNIWEARALYARSPFDRPSPGASPRSSALWSSVSSPRSASPAFSDCSSSSGGAGASPGHTWSPPVGKLSPDSGYPEEGSPTWSLSPKPWSPVSESPPAKFQELSPILRSSVLGTLTRPPGSEALVEAITCQGLPWSPPGSVDEQDQERLRYSPAEESEKMQFDPTVSTADSMLVFSTRALSSTEMERRSGLPGPFPVSFLAQFSARNVSPRKISRGCESPLPGAAVGTECDVSSTIISSGKISVGEMPLKEISEEDNLIEEISMDDIPMMEVPVMEIPMFVVDPKSSLKPTDAGGGAVETKPLEETLVFPTAVPRRNKQLMTRTFSAFSTLAESQPITDLPSRDASANNWTNRKRRRSASLDRIREIADLSARRFSTEHLDFDPILAENSLYTGKTDDAGKARSVANATTACAIIQLFLQTKHSAVRDTNPFLLDSAVIQGLLDHAVCFSGSGGADTAPERVSSAPNHLWELVGERSRRALRHLLTERLRLKQMLLGLVPCVIDERLVWWCEVARSRGDHLEMRGDRSTGKDIDSDRNEAELRDSRLDRGTIEGRENDKMKEGGIQIRETADNRRESDSEVDRSEDIKESGMAGDPECERDIKLRLQSDGEAISDSVVKIVDTGVAWGGGARPRIEDIDALRDKLFSELGGVALSSFGRGEVDNILLRGNEEERGRCAVSLCYLIGSRRGLASVYLLRMNCLPTLLSILLPPRSALFHRAVPALCHLASALRQRPSPPSQAEGSLAAEEGIKISEKNKGENEVSAMFVEAKGIFASDVVIGEKSEVFFAGARDCERMNCLNHKLLRAHKDQNVPGAIDQSECNVVFLLDDGSRVSASRAQLTQASPVFTAMLDGSFSEARAREVLLREASCAPFALLLALVGAAGECATTDCGRSLQHCFTSQRKGCDCELSLRRSGSVGPVALPPFISCLPEEVFECGRSNPVDFDVNGSIACEHEGSSVSAACCLDCVAEKVSKRVCDGIDQHFFQRPSAETEVIQHRLSDRTPAQSTIPLNPVVSSAFPPRPSTQLCELCGALQRCCDWTMVWDDSPARSHLLDVYLDALMLADRFLLPSVHRRLSTLIASLIHVRTVTRVFVASLCGGAATALLARLCVEFALLGSTGKGSGGRAMLLQVFEQLLETSEGEFVRIMREILTDACRASR